MAYKVTINGVERTKDIATGSLSIEDVINDQVNSCSFVVEDFSGLGFPSKNDEVIVYQTGTVKIFGGRIITVGKSFNGSHVVAAVKCVDYTKDLDRLLVHKTYQNKTDKQIIQEIIATYASTSGITTTNVTEDITIDQISFNYLQPSQCFRKIAELSGKYWYIDYEKDIHFFDMSAEAAPFNITATSSNYSNLSFLDEGSQVKNRVYVRGGTKLSDFTTYKEKGDGEKRQFKLPDKPHDVTVKVNGVTKSLGIKHIDNDGFDWYLNFQEKYLDQDSGGTTLSSSDTLEVIYKYDIPILVALEDTASIAENGVEEFAIFDKSISTTKAARDRATAELTDYANSLVSGSFSTFEHGFRSGQTININHAGYGVNSDFVIQRVQATVVMNGFIKYDITFASARAIGIIKFLITLLEANKNLIELDDQEVIDELFNLTDSLNADSLYDTLTIDSQGAYATWASSNEDATPTIARWNLFQW